MRFLLRESLYARSDVSNMTEASGLSKYLLKDKYCKTLRAWQKTVRRVQVADTQAEMMVVREREERCRRGPSRRNCPGHGAYIREGLTSVLCSKLRKAVATSQCVGCAIAHSRGTTCAHREVQLRKVDKLKL